ncbi:MAG: HK97-gp10 family putative phage morphogenesis protein [Mesorhizobium sp.]
MARNKDLDAIMRAFDAIPKEVRKPIRAALDKGADELTSRMRYLAPEDDGDLKRSIRKQALSDVAVRVEAGGEATTRPVREGVSATYDYSLGQEYGTADHPAQPFFWPSVRTLSKRVRRRVDRAIGKAVKETWGKK